MDIIINLLEIMGEDINQRIRKKYLYDVIDIKKKRATLLANNRLPDKKTISL